MNGTITLTDALNLLEDGAFHSVVYVGFDAKRNESGRIIRIPMARIVRRHNVYTTTASQDATPSKKQRHSLHATRNLTLKNNQNRKMHIHLLAMVDNKTVL